MRDLVTSWCRVRDSPVRTERVRAGAREQGLALCSARRVLLGPSAVTCWCEVHAVVLYCGVISVSCVFRVCSCLCGFCFPLVYCPRYSNR